MCLARVMGKQEVAEHQGKVYKQILSVGTEETSA